MDDITLFRPSGQLIILTKLFLYAKFKVTNMGNLHWLLGMQIEYFEDRICISQIAYIDKVLKCFGMYDCNRVSLPLDPNHKFKKENDNDLIFDSITYQAIIRSLMYTVIGTRPDLAFTVTFLLQFNT